MAEIGNPNSVSDAGVGALCARSAVMGAFMNVRINAKDCDDKLYVENTLAKGREIEKNKAARSGVTNAQSDEFPQQEQTRLSSFSGDNEWYTPSKYIELAREVLGVIDLDPASNSFAQKTVKAKKFYSVEMNGLDKKWTGAVWMNPPYSNPEIQQFAEKLIEGVVSKSVPAAIVLTNNSGDTAWHHALANASSAICNTLGRIRFESQTRESNSPAMGQSFFHFGNEPDKFARVFASIGQIYQHYIFDAAPSAANDNCLLAFAAGEQAYVLMDLDQPAQGLDKVRAVYD